jgi:ATP synthase in type III secretion protein N
VSIHASLFDPIPDRLRLVLRDSQLLQARGRVTEVVGTIIKAVVPGVQVGELCYLQSPDDSARVLAEVVGLANHYALLTPIGEMYGISTQTEVIPTGRQHEVAVGPELLGCVLDGLGEPLRETQRQLIAALPKYPVHTHAPDPMTRRLITRTLALGIKAVDGLLTCGEGQRLGIFAAAGGGKSTLLSMLVKGADVDVIVVALIGERGREVREFIELHLGADGMKKSVVVVATSERPAMERAKAAYVATTIAEFFRDQGKRVLLLMDSVTRFARALREIGLAAGEPPTRRGFPPSVFATLPKLMERVGQNDKGSITAFYTVLVEGDDMTEPVADETRSILDGHIILSRKLAMANHYPAIDILASTSRAMDKLVDEDHMTQAGKVRQLLAKYDDIELLVKVGEYKPGSDAIADRAIKNIEAIREFLQQPADQHCNFEDTLAAMATVA